MLPGTNRLAITALVGSIVGLIGFGSLLGLILGFFALREIKQQPQKGRELAILAMVIGGITGVIGLAILPSYLEESRREKKAGAETVVADELDKGDCILTLDESASVRYLPVVPCAQPHVAEVYDISTMPDGSYPGEEAVQKEGELRCDGAIRLYPKEKTGHVGITFLYPDAVTWYGNKNITCIAVEQNGTSTTSIIG
jgi:uncharacterized protein DUF4190/putative regulator of septum formation